MLNKLLAYVVIVGVILNVAVTAQAENRAPARLRANSDSQSTTAGIIPEGATQMPSTSSSKEYVLGTGDKIRLTVYGEEDLSGEYEVSSTGIVALPLIGDVQAAKLTVRNFEESVKSKFASGYLKDPRVSVQVANYRPFFILGEVSKPGSYAYVNGMTVLNGVAMAGGYTYRANTSGIIIVHASDPEKKEQTVGEDATVMPGDVIRVPERFF